MQILTQPISNTLWAIYTLQVQIRERHSCSRWVFTAKLQTGRGKVKVRQLCFDSRRQRAGQHLRGFTEGKLTVSLYVLLTQQRSNSTLWEMHFSLSCIAFAHDIDAILMFLQ